MVPGHPLVIGHRGASAAADENTLAAFALAVAQNADGIETDVRLTADREMVLHHDAILPDGTPIAELPLTALRRRQPNLVTPDELLAVAGDLLLDVEIKNAPVDVDHDPDDTSADLVVAWIRHHALESRVVVTSFNWQTTRKVRRLAPDVPTGQLLGGPVLMPSVIEAIAEEGHEWMLPGDRMLGPDPAPAITAAHAVGLRVAAWTVDDPGRIIALAAAGIDGVITNDPALAVATME